jgi:hypothetical protein
VRTICGSWHEFEGLRARYPELEVYGLLFQNALTESRTGRWPGIEEQRQSSP